MTIEENMKEVLEKYSGPDNPDLSVYDFYEEKKKEGLIRKQEYNIPPIDTVGVFFMQDTKRRSNK